MVEYYPINLNLKSRKCVVIGAGLVAQRRVNRLLSCGAKVTLISPKVSSALKTLAKNKKIVIKNKTANIKDLSSAYLVICATDDRKMNSFVSSYCKRKGVLVNVVDSPMKCNFILPSVMTRGNLTISISTGGVSPALSKKIRQDLEKIFGSEYAKFLRIMKKLRPEVIKTIKDPKSRKALFKRAVEADVPNLIKRDKEEQALRILEGIFPKGLIR